MHSPPVIVVAPDKFKGSLTAPAVAAAIERGLRRVWPDAGIRACPMADGGDGTLDAILSRGGARGQHEVPGAGGATLTAAFGLVDAPEGRTAVIEIAQCVALIDPVGTATPVERRTTRGVGLLIRALLDEGIRRFLVGLGGSSTNDGGAGMLAALGMRFVDAGGRDVAPAPEGLARIARADAAALDARLAQSDITIMSDVDNPLCGARGATAIFGPQKGVRAADVGRIDATLARYADIVESAMNRAFRADRRRGRRRGTRVRAAAGGRPAALGRRGGG